VMLPIDRAINHLRKRGDHTPLKNYGASRPHRGFDAAAFYPLSTACFFKACSVICILFTFNWIFGDAIRLARID
ncbi:MAG: hypothetical protein ACRD82_14110, partial [Blastocatellia bacterium]